MIDFVKIQIPARYSKFILDHHELNFQRPINEDTGEYDSRKARTAMHGKTRFGKMRFDYFPSGRMILSGSWHKHYTGDHNHNDFSLSQFTECVQTLCAKFRLNPDDLHLLQVETGVNIQTDQQPDEILKNILCDWSGETFSRMRQKNYQSIGIELYRREYGIKVYNKGRQYNLPKNVLRFELKMTSGKYCRRHGFQNLSDLIGANAWRSLSAMLLKTFDELLIIEPSMAFSKLSHSKQIFILNSRNSAFWRDCTPKQRMKSRGRLFKLVKYHAFGNLRNELRDAIFSKTKELNPDDALIKTGYVLPDSAEPRELQNGVCFTNSSNVVIHSTDPQPSQLRHCKTCGRDISDQRAGSIFCSESKFDKAAKKCRNTDSNPRNNYARALSRIEMQPMLFDHKPFLKTANF